MTSPMPSALSFSSAAAPLGLVMEAESAADRGLSFRGATVHVRAEGGLAVVVVTQRFVNPHASPLSVLYTLPLPHDAAVRGYSFRMGDRVVRGVVDGRKQARERFEQAVASGRTAGILDQERSTVFRQELGNLPPGQELEAVIELDQRLLWLDDGSWEWRFPTVVAPRYLGAAGRVADADALAVNVSEAPLSPRVSLELHVLDALTGKVSSSTHALSITQGEGVSVRLEGDTRLDRDIAVRWPVGRAQVGVGLRVARSEHTGGGSHGLVTVVPPTPTSRPKVLPRDLILLLDASGSMHGAPMQQSKELMRALIRSLGPADRLEMISFGNSPRRWQGEAAAVTTEVRDEALRWVDRLQAEGGTEMRAGILEATRTLREGAQRQVVLITDGLIGFESEIVRTLHESLPAGCRLHTVGVGSSINRSLTGPAARAGGGIEVILDLDGDVPEATRRLLARTVAPIVTELTIDGDAVLEHAPARLPDLFAGSPLLVSLRLRESGGSLRMRGRTPDGPWSTEITVPSVAPGEGPVSLRALFGRERVEDLEVLWATGREQGAIDRQIEQTGIAYQIATRLTSWVAVSEEATVKPNTPQLQDVVAQELPHGMSAVGLGLRAPSAMAVQMGDALEEEEAASPIMQTLERRLPSPGAPRSVAMPMRPAAGGAGPSKKSQVKERRSLRDESPASPAPVRPAPFAPSAPPPPAAPSISPELFESSDAPSSLVPSGSPALETRSTARAPSAPSDARAPLAPPASQASVSPPQWQAESKDARLDDLLREERPRAESIDPSLPRAVSSEPSPQAKRTSLWLLWLALVVVILLVLALAWLLLGGS